MRRTASRQLQKKRKAEAMTDGSEIKANNSEAGNQVVDKMNVSNDDSSMKAAEIMPPLKKPRHGVFSGKHSSEHFAKKSAKDMEDSSDDSNGGDNNMKIDKVDKRSKKVKALPGDPFTAARNNLVAQNTLPNMQHNVTPTPVSKIAKLSSKQATLAFDIGPPTQWRSVEAPRKPPELPDRAASPAKMTNVISETVAGGTGVVQTPFKERSFEEVRKGAKDVKEALALAQNDTLSFCTITEEGGPSPTRRSMFGPNTIFTPVVRTNDEVVEGIEERDAGLKSESYEHIGFDNLPVASASQGPAGTVSKETAADLAADSAVATVAMAIAAEAIAAEAIAAEAIAAEAIAAESPLVSEDTITVQSSVSDKSATKDVVVGSGLVVPKGTVAKRSGTGNAAKPNRQKAKPPTAQNAVPKTRKSPEIKSELVQGSTAKRASTNGKPAVLVSNAGTPVAGKSAASNVAKLESPARLRKNEDGSRAQKPKPASTSPTQAPAATAEPLAESTSTSAAISPLTAPKAAKQSEPQTTPPSKPHSSPALDRTLFFLITIESGTGPEHSNQLYHSFALSTPFALFRDTILDQLGPDEKLVFAAAGKGRVAFPGMRNVQFPIVAAVVEVCWGKIMRDLAGVVGGRDDVGEMVNVTFS